MNIAKLFEMQKMLDARIIEEKGLRGQDLLPNTILALQVELGEMANEWRGFKHWSNDQEPRVKVPATAWGAPYRNLLLEEYVDCLHFFLSIARQLDLGETDLTIIDDYLEGSTTKAISRLIYHTGAIGIDFSRYSTLTSFRMAFNIFFALGQQRFGFTLEQIKAAYLEKNKVNHERQANGY
ncbi:dUTP diphosphatase [Paenibacillus sp. FSL W8-0426]|uniref:dUTP diphosphatase n=1 Tax=Paenibacillus sp. FSL W8-0426 TaxID=2921714 RepID=UPI0030D7A52C